MPVIFCVERVFFIAWTDRNLDAIRMLEEDSN